MPKVDTDPSRIDYIDPTELAGKPLGDYDGVDITEVRGVLNAAGAIGETLKMAPTHYPIGSRMLMLLSVEVDSHEHDRVKEGKEVHNDEMVETVVFKTHFALPINPELGWDVMDAHIKMIEEARLAAEDEKRAARGELKLPIDDGKNDDDLV
jgi:hypothetical protein